MEEREGSSTRLFNIAPNGLKVDVVYLTPIPNVDGSGTDYRIEYVADFTGTERVCIGHCDLIMGNLRFDNVGEDAKWLGVSHKAVQLLVDWIDRNMEVH